MPSRPAVRPSGTLLRCRRVFDDSHGRAQPVFRQLARPHTPTRRSSGGHGGDAHAFRQPELLESSVPSLPIALPQRGIERAPRGLGPSAGCVRQQPLGHGRTRQVRGLQLSGSGRMSRRSTDHHAPPAVLSCLSPRRSPAWAGRRLRAAQLADLLGAPCLQAAERVRSPGWCSRCAFSTEVSPWARVPTPPGTAHGPPSAR